MLDDILAIRSRGKLIFVVNELLKDTVAQVAIFQEIEYGLKDVVSVWILAHVDDTALIVAEVISTSALWRKSIRIRDEVTLLTTGTYRKHLLDDSLTLVGCTMTKTRLDDVRHLLVFREADDVVALGQGPENGISVAFATMNNRFLDRIIAVLANEEEISTTLTMHATSFESELTLPLNGHDMQGFRRVSLICVGQRTTQGCAEHNGSRTSGARRR